MLEIHTKDHDFRSMYVGRKFRYTSKYGSVTEDILCRDVTVTVCHKIAWMSKDDTQFNAYVELQFISDKNNVYEFNEVEFYETDIPQYDPYTGELNPMYQQLTGQPNPWKPTMSKEQEQAKDELIKILYSQIVDLSMMSKIELGDDVIAEIKRLKQIINEQSR
jgi:hypothetical protein